MIPFLFELLHTITRVVVCFIFSVVVYFVCFTFMFVYLCLMPTLIYLISHNFIYIYIIYIYLRKLNPESYLKLTREKTTLIFTDHVVCSMYIPSSSIELSNYYTEILEFPKCFLKPFPNSELPIYMIDYFFINNMNQGTFIWVL